ncbi:class I SAM-dependent RNA methyltransferase [Clostridium swellfunianum]|uniref:THUMP domain-containing class I SAM-dependent RNA methyltransferase n=1 Tax=Clostridium swellfunianum TaxID=1367462 RepID=UPI00202F80FF|nr:class I SAM-dependent RNA methyltransferase [Clostridium swellfunianum]MCM0650394.1 class I SAM-dependent RNA methyltransferase [Clostridium swellfunianum]
MNYNLIATSTFGLESIVAKELKQLGYEDLVVDNGKVTFSGDEYDIAICNTWLRTADRVFIKMAEFKATTFEELFQGTLAVNWGELIPENGKMHVVGKSVKSTLFSVPDCQSIVKKGVVESMKKTYKTDWFEEDGPVYKIEISLLKDIAVLSVDTSGAGLHKRGYREYAGEAPMKETLAAALVLLSNWEPSRSFADLFCGSGTIAIEAALIGKNIAPGLNRSFVCEQWPNMDKSIWEEIRSYARSKINSEEFRILASDIDGRVLGTARANADKAGVSEYISFQRQAAQDFTSRKKYGCIISNPPYGERIGEIKQVEELYKSLGNIYNNLETWSLFIITSHTDFQKLFGKKADKNRKLYNGRLLCYYYQYINNPPKIKSKQE